ncbi:DNA-binding protein [Desulfitobacterium hafniense]|uniref:DNA-binding protein n=1 Tax=Desulfitobacterium hafniense TaxID=49338 RepID=UPI000AAF98EC|nr:DNA-binding protein [Desulfitobacterium hafniense]
MDYITAKEASENWGITVRRVQVLCAQNKIQGAIRFGSSWAIPKNSIKPQDGRYKKIKTKDA